MLEIYTVFADLRQIAFIQELRFSIHEENTQREWKDNSTWKT